jgi:hypothetical protein
VQTRSGELTAPLDAGAEDLAHDLSLGLEDLNPRPAIGPEYPAVPIGDLPERDLPRAGAIKLATTVALGHLSLLILGDHPLHLDRQRRLRII